MMLFWGSHRLLFGDPGVRAMGWVASFFGREFFLTLDVFLGKGPETIVVGDFRSGNRQHAPWNLDQ
jgi:hypothetical protein